MMILSNRNENRSRTLTQGYQDKVAILFENPDWLDGLFGELDRRGIPYAPIHMEDAAFGLDVNQAYPLYVNRVSPSSHIRGHGGAIRLATAMMEALEARGRKVINGSHSFKLETSKVSQHVLLESLGVQTPPTIIFNSRKEILRQVDESWFPAILKPDTGGSGAYVRKVSSVNEFEYILENEEQLFGPDQLLLLQTYLKPTDRTIIRTEFIDGELIYAMNVKAFNTFNLCPADSCERTAADPRDLEIPHVEFTYYPDISGSAVAQAREIVRYAKLDVGGVEFLETENGTRVFFDINATSIHREDMSEQAGKDANQLFVDYIEREYRKERRKLAAGNGSIRQIPSTSIAAT